MLPLDIFPGWVPADELLVATLAFLVLVRVFNKGNPWIWNVLAQDEPLLVAMGLFAILVAITGWFESTIGTIPDEVLWLVGGVAIALGTVARYSDDLDISGLI